METSGEVPYFCRFFWSIPTFADRTPLSPYFCRFLARRARNKNGRVFLSRFLKRFSSALCSRLEEGGAANNYFYYWIL